MSETAICVSMKFSNYGERCYEAEQAEYFHCLAPHAATLNSRGSLTIHSTAMEIGGSKTVKPRPRFGSNNLKVTEFDKIDAEIETICK